MLLSWSRAVFARYALDQTLESFMRGHVEAFSAFGGVPCAILYDNLKSVVLDRSGDHIRFNEAMLFMAGHHHFAPKPCAPYRGNEKGKVERTIQYLRHGFFAARRFSSVQDLNAQLAKWIQRVAHARKVPGDPAGPFRPRCARRRAAAAPRAPVELRRRPPRRLTLLKVSCASRTSTVSRTSSTARFDGGRPHHA
jgi:hypothetical protein